MKPQVTEDDIKILGLEYGLDYEKHGYHIKLEKEVNKLRSKNG